VSNRLDRDRTLEPEVFQLNYTLELSFYLTVSTLHLYYTARPANALNQENGTLMLPRCFEHEEASSLYNCGLIRLFCLFLFFARIC